MTDDARRTEVPLEIAAWGLQPTDAAVTDHLDRACLRFSDANLQPTVPGVRLADGIIEADFAVTGERSFHGLVWRRRDPDTFESFFVRPHQAGNPDAIQYTPVTNGMSSWQLYHGDGYWAPIAFPIDAWFTLRIAFAAERADVFVGDLSQPALRVRQLKLGAGLGGIGLQVGGPGLHVARFAYSDMAPALEPMPAATTDPAAVRAWEVSDPFAEAVLAGVTALPADLVAGRTWTPLESEPDGLANLARLHRPRDGANTVLARTVVVAGTARVVPMEVGFSDRATVFLNGRALFRGDDTYRSRDYRFLGSIGFWDTVFLPLDAGSNELVIAVSEDFGGWGIKARLGDY